ncbi:hypothetical protein SAMN05720761_101142 [Fibrobacter sp. UWCM]|uniref:hypothetical protein n=1 Tax=Fibrobacter sp. UWCM TaxID=1896208 RepID=UPI000911D4C5|nr:hypothetical protein [Fibrobacter sp. UWCM]SHG31507.1 hypothetical protein SAMN05720761_101142 [Fibrobacter sp. UWCM]
MTSKWMTENEKTALKASMDKLAGLRALKNTENVYDAFDAYKNFKDAIGNYNSDMAYISCLMAKKWLIKRFGNHVSDSLDVSQKSQSAKGFDIELRECDIVGEIKNTVPCKKKDDGFGAQQIASIDSDLQKLRNSGVKNKFFFVTDKKCFDNLKDEKFKQKLKGIELVPLFNEKEA